jgi:hypothetical protein
MATGLVSSSSTVYYLSITSTSLSDHMSQIK